MRLGQLSRKVDTKPTVIISYLKSEFDVTIGTHLNSKVDDALAEKVIEKFGKAVSEKEEVEPTPKTVETSEKETVKSAPIPEEKSESQTVAVEFTEVSDEIRLKAEVIKAPKIELEGPKVVGKIDLPPSLDEQMVEIDGVMISKADLAKRKREERLAKREKKSSKPSKSAQNARKSAQKSEEQLAQMKRDQEAKQLADKIARREKRIQEQLKKKKKESLSQSKVTAAPKRKSVKKTVKPNSEFQEEIQNQKPVPTTWWGKLWRWFNT